MAASNHSSGKPGGSWSIFVFIPFLWNIKRVCYFLLGIRFLSLFGDSAKLGMAD